MAFPIATEEFVEAYRKMGLKPEKEVWLDCEYPDPNPVCACPMAAVIAARKGIGRALEVHDIDANGDEDQCPYRYAAELLEITPGQARSFAAGVDDSYADRGDAGYDPEAYEAGKSTWLAVKHLAD